MGPEGFGTKLSPKEDTDASEYWNSIPLQVSGFYSDIDTKIGLKVLGIISEL